MKKIKMISDWDMFGQGIPTAKQLKAMKKWKPKQGLCQDAIMGKLLKKDIRSNYDLKVNLKHTEPKQDCVKGGRDSKDKYWDDSKQDCSCQPRVFYLCPKHYKTSNNTCTPVEEAKKECKCICHGEWRAHVCPLEHGCIHCEPTQTDELLNASLKGLEYMFKDSQPEPKCKDHEFWGKSVGEIEPCPCDEPTKQEECKCYKFHLINKCNPKCKAIKCEPKQEEPCMSECHWGHKHCEHCPEHTAYDKRYAVKEEEIPHTKDWEERFRFRFQYLEDGKRLNPYLDLQVQFIQQEKDLSYEEGYFDDIKRDKYEAKLAKQQLREELIEKIEGEKVFEGFQWKGGINKKLLVKDKIYNKALSHIIDLIKSKKEER